MVAAIDRYSPVAFLASDPNPYVYDDSGAFVPLFGGAIASAAETKYVDKNGSDTTGNGSVLLPYLTIQKAHDSITDATALKPYAVAVGPGIFASSFTFKPFVFVVGSGQTSTVINNPAANWLGSGFAGAGTLDTGISNCNIGTALVVDFAAIVSPGTGRFFFYNCLVNASPSFTANSNLNRVFSQNIAAHPTISTLTLTLTNFTGSRFDDLDWATNNISVVHNAAYVAFPLFVNMLCNTLTINCANAAPNLCTVSLLGQASINGITFTGDGAFVSSNTFGTRFKFLLTTPGADSTVTFSTLSAGALKMVNGADNRLQVDSGGAGTTRTITIIAPAANRTQLTIENANLGTVVLVYTGASGNLVTWLTPQQAVTLEYILSWKAVTYPPQRGRGIFVAGASIFIPADIIKGVSSVQITNTLITGAAIGLPVALEADIVGGTFAGGGGFIARSVTLAGAQVATDGSSFMWAVER